MLSGVMVVQEDDRQDQVAGKSVEDGTVRKEKYAGWGKSVRRVLGPCATGIKIQNEENKTFQDMFISVFSFFSEVHIY